MISCVTFIFMQSLSTSTVGCTLTFDANAVNKSDSNTSNTDSHGTLNGVLILLRLDEVTLTYSIMLTDMAITLSTLPLTESERTGSLWENIAPHCCQTV